MAMSKRIGEKGQEALDWPGVGASAGHPFYERLNELLEAKDSTSLWKGAAHDFPHAPLEHPSLQPGVYFRALLMGTSRASERAKMRGGWRIRWDCGGFRNQFDRCTPDHSTISRTRRSDRHRYASRGVHMGIQAARIATLQGTAAGDRRDDAGGQRGDALDLRRRCGKLEDAAGAGEGLGHRATQKWRGWIAERRTPPR